MIFGRIYNGCIGSSVDMVGRIGSSVVLVGRIGSSVDLVGRIMVIRWIWLVGLVPQWFWLVALWFFSGSGWSHYGSSVILVGRIGSSVVVVRSGKPIVS